MMKKIHKRPSPTNRLLALLAGGVALLATSAMGVPGHLSGLWLGQSLAKKNAPSAAQVAKGKRLFGKMMCQTCHSVDGTKKVGPTLKGIYGKKIKLKSGKVVVRNAAYIKRQLHNPKAEMVPGYPPLMPSYKGRLEGADLDAVVAYIRSLAQSSKSSPKKRPAPRRKAAVEKPLPKTPAALAMGKHYYRLNCAFCHGLDGKANAPGGRALSIPPKDFSKDKLLYGNDAKSIYAVITQGSPRTSLMPAWKRLPSKIRWAMAHYVASLRK